VIITSTPAEWKTMVLKKPQKRQNWFGHFFLFANFTFMYEFSWQRDLNGPSIKVRLAPGWPACANFLNFIGRLFTLALFWKLHSSANFRTTLCISRYQLCINFDE
jgi:hypothetical protein